MSNPAIFPLLIVVAGIAWGVMVAFTTRQLSETRYLSTEGLSWFRLTGLPGFAIAQVLAVVAFVRNVL